MFNYFIILHTVNYSAVKYKYFNLLSIDRNQFTTTTKTAQHYDLINLQQKNPYSIS